MNALVRLYFWLKRVWIPLSNGFDCQFPFVIVLFIRAIAAITLGTTLKSKCEAITVELQALRFLTIADWSRLVVVITCLRLFPCKLKHHFGVRLLMLKVSMATMYKATNLRKGIQLPLFNKAVIIGSRQDIANLEAGG